MLHARRHTIGMHVFTKVLPMSHAVATLVLLQSLKGPETALLCSIYEALVRLRSASPEPSAHGKAEEMCLKVRRLHLIEEYGGMNTRESADIHSPKVRVRQERLAASARRYFAHLDSCIIARTMSTRALQGRRLLAHWTLSPSDSASPETSP